MGFQVNIASTEKKLEIERRHRRENTTKLVKGDDTINLQVLVDQICSLQEKVSELEKKLEKKNE